MKYKRTIRHLRRNAIASLNPIYQLNLALIHKKMMQNEKAELDAEQDRSSLELYQPKSIATKEWHGLEQQLDNDYSDMVKEIFNIGLYFSRCLIPFSSDGLQIVDHKKWENAKTHDATAQRYLDAIDGLEDYEYDEKIAQLKAQYKLRRRHRRVAKRESTMGSMRNKVFAVVKFQKNLLASSLSKKNDKDDSCQSSSGSDSDSSSSSSCDLISDENMEDHDSCSNSEDGDKDHSDDISIGQPQHPHSNGHRHGDEDEHDDPLQASVMFRENVNRKLEEKRRRDMMEKQYQFEQRNKMKIKGVVGLHSVAENSKSAVSVGTLTSHSYSFRDQDLSVKSFTGNVRESVIRRAALQGSLNQLASIISIVKEEESILSLRRERQRKQAELDAARNVENIKQKILTEKVNIFINSSSAVSSVQGSKRADIERAKERPMTLLQHLRLWTKEMHNHLSEDTGSRAPSLQLREQGIGESSSQYSYPSSSKRAEIPIVVNPLGINCTVSQAMNNADNTPLHARATSSGKVFLSQYTNSSREIPYSPHFPPATRLPIPSSSFSKPFSKKVIQSFAQSSVSSSRRVRGVNKSSRTIGDKERNDDVDYADSEEEEEEAEEEECKNKYTRDRKNSCRRELTLTTVDMTHTNYASIQSPPGNPTYWETYDADDAWKTSGASGAPSEARDTGLQCSESHAKRNYNRYSQMECYSYYSVAGDSVSRKVKLGVDFRGKDMTELACQVPFSVMMDDEGVLDQETRENLEYLLRRMPKELAERVRLRIWQEARRLRKLQIRRAAFTADLEYINQLKLMGIIPDETELTDHEKDMIFWSLDDMLIQNDIQVEEVEDASQYVFSGMMVGCQRDLVSSEKTWEYAPALG